MQKLYPPLAKSDYIKDQVSVVACIIKYGASGSIVVNDVEYNMQMPAYSELTPLEIAEIVTYISNSWGNEEGYYPVQQAQKDLAGCRK